MKRFSSEFRNPFTGKGIELVGSAVPVVGKRKGDEGDKYYADAFIRVGSSLHEAGRYFIKKFSEVQFLHPDNARHPLQQLAKWMKLRELGLPVVSLFRVDRAQRQILMTDVTEKGKNKIFDTNTPWSPELGSIDNIQDLKQEAKEIALKAFANGEGVYLGTDAYAVVVNPKGHGRLMLLDLGVGSHVLDHGYIRGSKEPLQEKDVLLNASMFNIKVLTEPV